MLKRYTAVVSSKQNLKSHFILACLIVLIITNVYAQTFPKSPEPWREEYNISLNGFQFSHPMTVINQSDLDKMKERIANNVEPQRTAFDELISEASAQLAFVPDAPATMDIMGGYEPNSNLSEMREWLWRNCHAAYTCALAYAFTDETVYAEKAKEVLMDWANTGTTFTGGDRGLQLGSWFSPMLYAADLIYDYVEWSEAERNVFRSWWRNNCVLDGDVLDVMRRKDNNWKDAGILGILSAAVVLEDTLYLKEALIQLKSYFFSRTDEYVRLPGPGWKIKKDENGAYLPREVVRNEGSSGLTYTAYALTTMVQCLEIARYSGFNFWYNSTEEEATIEDVINQYYAWDLKNEPFPWNSNPKKTDKRRNSYELANTFLNVDPELKDWVMSHWPQLNGREGDEYCTLNKGDLLGTGILPPNKPDSLIANPVSHDQVNLTWKDRSTDEEGFQISRKKENSAYIMITVTDSNTTFYHDRNFLSENTTYTYKVRAYRGTFVSPYSEEIKITTLDDPTVIWEDSFDGSHGIPYKMCLEQNYPNPFNPGTIINYELRIKSDVDLSVYNLMGQKVTTLISNTQPAGYHQVEWNASGFSAGVYYYVLEAGDFRDVKKMVLLK